MTSRPVSATSTCQPAGTTTRTLSDLANTIFTPPASCLQSLYKNPPFGNDSYEKYTDSSLVTTSRTISTSTWTQDYVIRGRDPSCFPPNFPTTTCLYSTLNGSSTVSHVSEQSYVYSPARCPQNYVTATSSVDETNTELTRAVCCPVNFNAYDFDGYGAAECWSAPTETVTLQQRTGNFYFLPYEVNAPTIQIAWQSTDLARWYAPATSTPTSSIATPSGAATSSGAAVPSGLSTGAKAGIGIGAAAAVLIAIAAIIFLVLRRRRKARDVPQGPHHDVVPETQQSETFNEGKRHSGMTTLQGYPSPAPGYQSPSPAHQSPPQGYYSQPQEYQGAAKPETYRHMAEGSDPAELESGWRGWEAPGGNTVGTNGGDQIHAQGVTYSQDLPEISSVRR